MRLEWLNRLYRYRHAAIPSFRPIAKLLSGGNVMRKISRSTLVCLSLSIICWLALPNMADAQAVAIAQVSGNVTDQSGSAIPNAQVQMTETDKQAVHSTVTNAQGQYV